MKSYKDLLAERRLLDARIEHARRVERACALTGVRAAVAEFGLTHGEIFGTRRAVDGRGTSRAPMYQDPVSGATWSGRGRRPQWLTPGNLERCRIRC